jgi:thiamine monophosphate kinase
MHFYVAFLGGELANGRIGEDHEIVFVVADNELSARKAAKAKWGGGGKPHVDTLTKVEQIDGYALTLTDAGEGDLTEVTGYN